MRSPPTTDLFGDQTLVDAPERHEGAVGPRLHHPAILHDEDEVGLPHRRQALSDRHGGPAFTRLQTARMSSLQRSPPIAPVYTPTTG